MRKCVLLLVIVCLVLMGFASNAMAQEKTDTKNENGALVQKIEKLRGQLRERKINLEEFKKEFRAIEGLPTGPKVERVLAANSTEEMRSALDSLKEQLQPTPAWVKVALIVLACFVVLIIVAALVSGDATPLLFFFIFSGGRGSDI